MEQKQPDDYIKSIYINEANFENIAKYGIINGSLLVSLRDMIRQIQKDCAPELLKENEELKKLLEPIPCVHCNGSGIELGYENSMRDCKHCKGSGQEPPFQEQINSLSNQNYTLREQVSALTKENGAMKNMLHGYIGKEKALTEQVEKLSKEDIYKSTVIIPKFEKELSRLREERKELVEALRETLPLCKDKSIHEYNYGSYDAYQKYDAIVKKAESLLSKFEVPKT